MSGFYTKYLPGAGSEDTGGGGTDVVANPSGTDGTDITRIEIDGANYNIAASLDGTPGFRLIGTATPSDALDDANSFVPVDLGFDIPDDVGANEMWVLIAREDDNDSTLVVSHQFPYSELSGKGDLTAGTRPAGRSDYLAFPVGDSRGAYELFLGKTSTGDLLIASSGSDAEDLISVSLYRVTQISAPAPTPVEANPDGTDGDNLTRIAIDGTNYNLAASSEGGSGGGAELIGENASFTSSGRATDTGIDIPGGADDDELWVFMVDVGGASGWTASMFKYGDLAAVSDAEVGDNYTVSASIVVYNGLSALYLGKTSTGDLLYFGLRVNVTAKAIRLYRFTGGGGGSSDSSGGSGATIHTYSRDPGQPGDADVGKDNDWWFNIAREETLIAWNKVGASWVRLIDLDDSFDAIAHRLDYDDQRLSFVKSTEDVTGWALATAEQSRAGYKRVIKETSDLANTTFAISDFFDVRDTQLMGDANATWVFAMAVPKGIHPDHVQIVVEKGATDIFFPGADTHWEKFTDLTGTNPLIDYYFLANDSDDSLHGWGSGTGGYAGAARIATSTSHLRWVYDPPLIGEATFDLDGSVTNQKLLNASNDPIVCPADGWLDFALNVPRIGLSATVERVRCVDLRAAERADRNAVGLYTNSANEIFLRIPSHSRASTGNTVSVYRVESPSA